MRTVNIDGLPGLTMQGIKGSLGERGGSMFYNAGSNFAISSSFSKAMAISEDVIDKEELESSDIKCIPCDGELPIKYDYFFNVENNYTSLYVVKDIIYFYITSYEEEGVNLHPEQLESYDSSVYSNLVKELIPIIGKYLKSYNSVKNLQTISKADIEMFEKYPVYIIKYIDTWEYLDENPTATDIGISAITTSIVARYWDGMYIVKKQKCSGHKFDVINVADERDKQYLASVAETHSGDVQSGKITFRLLDASTYLPISEIKSGEYAIFENTESMNWLGDGIETFERDNPTNIVDSGSFIEDPNGKSHTIDLGDKVCERAYMRISVEGYFTTRVFLNGNAEETEYTIYIFRNILSDEVLNVDFEVVHEYDYIDSSEVDPKSEYYEFVYFTKFYVNSSMTSEEKSKFRIEAEFTSGSSKKYTMSTMRDKLWKVEDPDETYTAYIDSSNDPESQFYMRHGYYKNFDHTLNFDEEDPGDFTIVIKDYNEGNDVKLFSSSAIIPQFLKNDYEMTIYAYYRITSDNCIKLYLGKGTFGDTIA